MRKVVITFITLVALILSFLPVNASNDHPNVFVIPIKEDITNGLHVYLNRAIKEAEQQEADLIIFEMDTNGGIVNAAINIGNSILNTDIKTVTFINSRAISAGAYIALYTDEIYMSPNATMGAAAVIDSSGNAADEKVRSMWLASMEGAAKLHGRDPNVAKAMASADIDLPDLKEEGKLLTLTADSASKVGYSEGTVKSIDEIISALGYERGDRNTVPKTFADSLASFITNPIVVPILLSIASIGLVLELYSPGFGLPGGMGLSALLLFFFGHYIAGFAGYESIILLILGIGLIVAEFFLPGGIAGTLGAAAVIGSIIMAGYDVIQMATSIIIAIFLAAVAIIIMVKVFGKRMKFFRKLILSDATTTEQGYVSNVNRLDLIGREGIAVTDLRPSGVIRVDEERIDVVAEGSFIEKDSKVKVIKAEGSRIVVREL